MAVLALEERLAAAEWNEGDPEEMEEGARRARLELRVLAATRALLQRAGPLAVVAHDLAGAEKNDHIASLPRNRESCVKVGGTRPAPSPPAYSSEHLY